MTDVTAAAFNRKSLARWRADPGAFIEENLVNPETGKPFALLQAEQAFLDHAYRTDDDGRLLYQDQAYCAPKKSGKTEFAAMNVLTAVLIFGGRNAEGYCVANDYEQAQSRVHQACRRIVEASPLLRREAKVFADGIEFPATGASITAIASDYAGAAGAHPTISSFDEPWGFVHERARRLWDEMVPVPTRRISMRFVTSYAGFTGESALLEDIYRRGMAQPLVGDDLRAGDGTLMFWSHRPIAPWQDGRWLAQMRRSLRPNQYLRMIENRFVTTESSFVDLDNWDACVDPSASPVLVDRSLRVHVGVDASVKRDSTAIVAVALDPATRKVRLVAHRIFQPTKKSPLDFEATVEETLHDFRRRFRLRSVVYDPYQLASVMQRLERAGMPVEEYPQTPGNLTAMGQNLYELVNGRNLVAYPDAAVRLAVQRAVAVETPRGWKISKEKQSHKIDVVVALAMACHAAVQDQRPPRREISEAYLQRLSQVGPYGSPTSTARSGFMAMRQRFQIGERQAAQMAAARRFR
jgi:hypothetical protein